MASSEFRFEFELPQRSDMHWRRKIWHMSTVFILFLIQYYLSHDTTLALLTVGWLAFVPLDFLRQRSVELNRFLLKLFKPIVRKNEIHRLAGTTYLLTGVILIHLIFDPRIVSLSLLFLAFADPIASYFGIRFGTRKIWQEKSLQGTLAAFFVCMICTAVYISPSQLSTSSWIVFCLFAGLIGSLAELVTIKDLDDNLTLPLLSAGGLWILFFLFSV